MSSGASSPRSGGSSPSSSPASILTPGRKVKALLAQFDDSDSASDLDDRDQINHKSPSPRKQSTPPPQTTKLDLDSSEDDDILPGQRPVAQNETIVSSPRLESPTTSPGPQEHKSKFLALVEKHRKERLEKEAEEAAKQSSRLELLKAQDTRQRGSSPADDSDEDSDDSAGDGAKKLSTQARPTRKASKKALEEMHRETQRISRNMQLAHQARTKKRITKDSLLARFNLSTSASSLVSEAIAHVDASATSSSLPASDNEGGKDHDTPPTSPLLDPRPANDDKAVAAHGCVEGVRASEDNAVPASTLQPQQTRRTDKGKGRAVSLEPPVEDAHPLAFPTLVSRPGTGVAAVDHTKPPGMGSLVKSSLAGLKSSGLGDSDSDSDLEVITNRGDTRKYAAFEHLPKRKAKEAPSHLALRSLANLLGSEDRKRSMNAAEMELSLRKAARLQAREERLQKIEELKAKGIEIQTSEEREREQQEVEDLLQRARQEAAEIQKREKALAKKEGNYTRDGLDDEDESEDDEDFEDVVDDDADDGSDDESAQADEDDEGNLVDNEADEADSEASASESENEEFIEDEGELSENHLSTTFPRKVRMSRVVLEDEEDEEIAQDQLRSPQLPVPVKTPQSLSRSARKQIPGLQMSDELPMGLTQAFAATMAESQSQDTGNTQEQDSLTMTADLPSPNIAMLPGLYRFDSIDVITDSQPPTQTQPLNIDLSISSTQRVPQSPAQRAGEGSGDFNPSQVPFEPTQDVGYVLSPFTGDRFENDNVQRSGSRSTLESADLLDPTPDSPLIQRKSRLMRGRGNQVESDEEPLEEADKSAFEVMKRAARRNPRQDFDKAKSGARNIVDEAAEESEDEYAGLGGASDDDDQDEENEEDRRMIDEDTQVGVGDEAKLAKLFADRERQQDEAAVSKLLKDITTGALRRKRGNDDLDLSDEEDAAVRRRQAKRREFAKMRRELLKDEAVGKIAEDKKKEAFLRSIEDRPESDDDGEDFNMPETPLEDDTQASEGRPEQQSDHAADDRLEQSEKEHVGDHRRSLGNAGASRVNQGAQYVRRTGIHINRKPGTLAEIRESVSFLIEEPDSQAATIDLGLSDSEDEPEAYVNLDRHLEAAEADENARDADDLGDFIVDDEEEPRQADDDAPEFKKPGKPLSETTRAPFSERRTKDRANVVNRLNMLRQASSSSTSGSSGSTKMAFYSGGSSASGSFSKVPTLLRRATTNSSLGSKAGRDENVSATGVVTNRTERGNVGDEKEFVRKGSGGRRNAVNYRPTIKEEKMSQRAGIAKKGAAAKTKKAGFLGALFQQNSWA